MVIAAAAALPLLVLVRGAFVRVMELAPPDVMRDVIETYERTGKLRGRMSRRLIAALVTPVVFLTVGSTLIASAHLRSADELDLSTASADPDTRAAQATASRGGDSPRGGASSRVGVALPDAEIRRAARLFDLPENLVRAVVLTESGGRADALSPKGAVGYMQVMPSTGKEMGASDLRDPWQNLYAGAKYLRKQLDRFGNLEHALAAYNAGPGAVERHGGIPPYRETREYVRRVFSWMNRFDRPGA